MLNFSLRILALMAVMNFFGVVVVVAGYNGSGKDEAALAVTDSDWLVLSIFDDAILPEYVLWHNEAKSDGDERLSELPYLLYRGKRYRMPETAEGVESYKNYDLKSGLLRPFTEDFVRVEREKRGKDCFIRVLMRYVPFYGKVLITGGRIQEEFDVLFSPGRAEIMQRRGALFIEITADHAVRETRVPYRNEELPGSVCHQLRTCLEDHGYRDVLRLAGSYCEVKNNGSKEELHAAMLRELTAFAEGYEQAERLIRGLG